MHSLFDSALSVVNNTSCRVVVYNFCFTRTCILLIMFKPFRPTCMHNYSEITVKYQSFMTN